MTKKTLKKRVEELEEAFELLQKMTADRDKIIKKILGTEDEEKQESSFSRWIV